MDGYILMDDSCMESGIIPDERREISFPDDAIEMEDEDDDADSHGNDETYGRLRYEASRRLREEFDLSTTYPLANSHGNAYRESSSHTRYSELYSELAVKNYLEVNREDVANYSVANSHGDHSTSSENRERSVRDNMEADQTAWDNRQQPNYEIANSHSNYRVFYDSQTQQRGLLQTAGWSIESWREHLFGNKRIEEQEQNTGDLGQMRNEESVQSSSSEMRGDSSTEPACDIEECLVQIEESLLNIEQNLLHVQDLDIPELRNLLYKSPSIEKSLYEVQDLLYADGIVPTVTKMKTSTIASDDEHDEDEEDEEEEEEQEVWVDHDIIVKGNGNEDDDAGAGAFDAPNEESSDTVDLDENNQSGTMNDHRDNDCVDSSTLVQSETIDSNCIDKEMNFIPNSLNKTLPRSIVLDGTKENIRLCSSKPEEPTIDYNLNTTCVEKRLHYHDKFPNRTSSLDDNSTFSAFDSTDKRESGKSSLQDLLFASINGNSLDLSAKARSEEILQTPRYRSPRRNGRESNERRWNILKVKTAEIRKKYGLVPSNERFTAQSANDQKRVKFPKDATLNVPRTREKSPNRNRRNTVSTDKTQEREKETIGGKSSDKKKRKKISSKSQSSSENALVPSKLISLSLSLLLAALLQAVRCLTDLVEDTFRSVSYDRSGLLQ